MQAVANVDAGTVFIDYFLDYFCSSNFSCNLDSSFNKLFIILFVDSISSNPEISKELW
jgi:hypothetical protein